MLSHYFQKKELIIKSNIKKLILGLSIGGLFLYLTLRQIDFSVCWMYIKKADFLLIFFASLVFTMGFMIRSVRWKYLLAPLKLFSPTRLFPLLIIGFFMNNVLPLRLGELMRVQVSGKKLGLARTGVLATVVVERLFDGLGIIFLFFLTIFFLPIPEWAKKSFIAGSFIFVGGLVFLFFLVRHKDVAVRMFSKLPFHSKLAQRLEGMFINFIDGLQVFSQGTVLARILVLSIIVWTIEGSVFYIIASAFSLNINIFQAFFVVCVISSGAALPPAPGYVGTVEFLGVTALSFLGIDKSLAFACIVTIHAMQLITITILGVWSLVVEKITMAELIHVKK